MKVTIKRMSTFVIQEINENKANNNNTIEPTNQNKIKTKEKINDGTSMNMGVQANVWGKEILWA